MKHILVQKVLWGLLNVVVIATVMFALVWLGLQAVSESWWRPVY
jgi:hypothetical protein